MTDQPLISAEHDINAYLPYLLAHASALVSRQVDEMAAAHDLSRNEVKVLMVLIGLLEEQAGMSLNELADIMIVKQPTLSRVVDGMVRDGLVARQTTDQDRRAVALRLTAKGRHRAEPLLDQAGEQDGDLRRYLGAKNADQLIRLLNHVIGAGEKSRN